MRTKLTVVTDKVFMDVLMEDGKVIGAKGRNCTTELVEMDTLKVTINKEDTYWDLKDTTIVDVSDGTTDSKIYMWSWSE